MADETVIGEDSTQISVALENDPKQIKSLALEPVRRTPDIAQGLHHRQTVIGRKYLQAHALVQAHRQKVRHHAETQSGLRLILVSRVINAAQVHQLLEPAVGV